ncbi:hypothetical protein TEA_017557 [Camellia sinensis var. sinensis]|uniref:Glycoside hydrolase family 3 N-terminal domain-containing protein n=1 Tax=Camellia sinensis var. sinensis TaxID=542762 RepID=A0A4S4DBQ6_CAMSN|nr:hypothetical protein TEA_017557 [Camellia sinensis var. sinensis]
MNNNPIYKNPNSPIESRIKDLLSRMTLSEKIGQITQIDRRVATRSAIRDLSVGSILSAGGGGPYEKATSSDWIDMIDRFQNAALESRLGIPLLYGTDAVHGNNNVYGATVFPHNIGLGATRDAELVRRIGVATALEVRACGAQFTFAPCVALQNAIIWLNPLLEPSMPSDFYLIMGLNRIIEGKLRFPLPDIKIRRCIFQIHKSRMTLADDVNLEEFVMTKDEFSGADIKAICTEAGLLALRERRGWNNMHPLYSIPRTCTTSGAIYGYGVCFSWSDVDEGGETISINYSIAVLNPFQVGLQLVHPFSISFFNSCFIEGLIRFINLKEHIIEKDVKAPNLLKKEKEHAEKSHHHHHKETHGTSDDIDEDTPIDEVKGPNVFERIKEEIEAVVQEILPKK